MYDFAVNNCSGGVPSGIKTNGTYGVGKTIAPVKAFVVLPASVGLSIS